MAAISISTKTGDDGTTGLANGIRVRKDAPIMEVIGTLDELNSWLGLIAAQAGSEFPAQRNYLYDIQDTLFYIGAEVAQSPKTKLQKKSLTALEKQADQLQAAMAEGWHTKFLLPGGTVLGSYLDIARTVSRRLERRVITLQQEQHTSEIVLQYLNRLSDYLYLLRCFVNTAVEYREQQFEVSDKTVHSK